MHLWTVVAWILNTDRVLNPLTSVLKVAERILRMMPVPRWLIPMKAGDTLVFTSHCWHRSSPNGRRKQNRVAYIQTWVHPQARWRPNLVPWHPVNEHLHAAGLTPGDVMPEKRHPAIWPSSIGRFITTDSTCLKSNF